MPLVITAPAEVEAGQPAAIAVSTDEAARTETFDVEAQSDQGATLVGTLSIKVDPVKLVSVTITQKAPVPGDQLVQDPSDPTKYTFTPAA